MIKGSTRSSVRISASWELSRRAVAEPFEEPVGPLGERRDAPAAGNVAEGVREVGVNDG